MDLGLRGRQALLSGASRGLGHACAFALAREGADVSIVARKRDVLEKAGAEIAAATGVKVTTVAADITTGAGFTQNAVSATTCRITGVTTSGDTVVFGAIGF